MNFELATLQSHTSNEHHRKLIRNQRASVLEQNVPSLSHTSRHILYLYLNQQTRCYWCGIQCLSPTLRFNPGQRVPRNAFSREHILPRHTRAKGVLRWWNIVGACLDCNSRRNSCAPEIPAPEAIRFARLTGVDPTGGLVTRWAQSGRTG
jgi:hypothetical protein